MNRSVLRQLLHTLLGRTPRVSGDRGTRLYATVSDADTEENAPFPYVWISDDGDARELDAREREYLRTPFHPADGARPYVKASYQARTPDGGLRGFLKRNRLPRGMTVRAAPLQVDILEFPETRVAALEHRGPPELEHQTARRLVEWRTAHGLSPLRHASYGIHYTDPRITPPAEHRVDFCVAYEGDVAPNPQGVVSKTIPARRCAVARHLGSRENISAAAYLYEVWLPPSGESAGDFPMFFHYVNVGPDVREEDMITDVYLPLR